ncbi:MAG TPA: hypothetical protein VFL14_05320 [Xanthomonadales bacterium]|nr:hypothetical protein [Xanthomonadales bacterium]
MFTRLAAAVLLLAAAVPAHALIFLVNNPADSGPGTLRAAVAALPITGEHFVIFNFPQNTTINLQSALPAFRTPSVYFDGTSAPGLTVRAVNGTRIFAIGTPGALTTVTLARFRVADGVGGEDGGGCFYDPPREFPSTLKFDRMVFENCSTTATNANGGAIKASWFLEVVDSTFIGNRATAATANGSARGGAIWSARFATIARSRFIGNEALAVSPAGFATGSAVDSAQTTVVQSSFVGNRAAGSSSSALGALACTGGASCSVSASSFRGNIGGGMYVSGNNPTVANTSFVDNVGRPALLLFLRDGAVRLDNVSFLERNGVAPANPAHLFMQGIVGETAQVSVSNTLFGPTAGTASCAISPSAVVAGGGWNIAVDASCNLVGAGTSSVIAGDLGQLDPVVAAGSAPAEVIPLVATSVALDVGSPGTPGVDPGACLPLDAGGSARPQDGDGDGFTGCDVGAYERANERYFADGFEG